jgi:hypothetical protein
MDAPDEDCWVRRLSIARRGPIVNCDQDGKRKLPPSFLIPGDSKPLTSRTLFGSKSPAGKFGAPVQEFTLASERRFLSAAIAVRRNQGMPTAWDAPSSAL